MFKVMTLNCNHFNDKQGSWPERKAIIKKMIEESCPDVVALQALEKSPTLWGGEDQAKQISLETGLDGHTFISGDRFPDGRLRGQGFLARGPFEEPGVKKFSLTEGQGDEATRMLLELKIQAGKSRMTVFNVHYSWIRKQTEKNVKETLPFLQDCREPAILLGDMNAERRSGLLDPLLDSGWSDLWEVFRTNENGFTFESSLPKIRIDYAWANAEMMPYVDSIELINRGSGNGKIHQSDHAALMVTLKMGD